MHTPEKQPRRRPPAHATPPPRSSRAAPDAHKRAALVGTCADGTTVTLTADKLAGIQAETRKLIIRKALRIPDNVAPPTEPTSRHVRNAV